MNRTVSVVAFLCVAAAAVGLGYWALHTDAPAPDAASSVASSAGDAADAGAPGATPRARAAAQKRAADPTANTKAVAGVVLADGARPVAGATVECYRLPEGEPEDDIRRGREALRGVVGDDADVDEVLRQFGRGAEVPSADRVQRSMRTGQRIGARLATDPAAMGRALRMGSEFGAGLESDASLERVASVTTDASGAFRIDDLAPGRVELRVTAAKHQRRKTRAAVGDVDLKVRLAPAGTISGEVRRAGRPVAGADVRFRAAVVKTDAGGRFRYDGGRPPREPVVASAPGCVTRGVWATVELGKDGDEVVIDLDPAGTVTGTVTSVAGAPIAGATITAAPDASGMMRMFMPQMGGDVVPVPPPAATTRADGTYSLEGVPARSIRLRADRDGFLGAAAAPVRVQADAVAEHVDFVLSRESVLEGRVTDAQGKPVAEAEVSVEVPGEGVGRMMAQFMGGLGRTGRTDGDGMYRVNGLPAGGRKVTVDADGFLKKKSEVTLPMEGSLRQDFVLEPGFRVAGVVLAPDGTPVAGAAVAVAAKGGDRPANPMMGMFQDSRNTTTDASGQFVAGGLQEGPYDITATAPKYLAGTATGVQPGAEGVTVRLGAAATLRGVVVSSADGKPVADATVLRKGKAARASGNPFLERFARDPSVTTGPDGSFEIGSLAPGQYEVWARAKGYAESVRAKVQATADAVTDGLSLALPPGASVTGRMLRKADGTPVEGGLVFVRADGPAAGLPPVDPTEILGDAPSAPADSVSARTAADGTFTLDGLTPGKVTMEARGAGFAPRTLAATDVPASNVIVEMSAGGTLEGTVFDKDGRPLEGATVIMQQGMMGTGFTRTATSDRAGVYRIERIPPGSFTAMMLDSESPMGMSGMKSVAIRDSETTRHDFGKPAAGSPVEGSVIADGKPMDGATVMLLGGPGGMQMAQTDATGRFRFDHAEAGEYSVMVQSGAMGGGSQTTKVKVLADGTVANVSLELSTLAVEGTVVDAESGKPVAFAQAVLLASGGSAGASMEEVFARQKGQAFSDASGRFRIAGAPKGSFTLRVTAAGFAEAEIEGVSPGGAAVRVSMSRGLEFTATVLGPDGKPVASASVIPEDANGRQALAFDMTMTKTTGADGVARFRLQPGRYVLNVRATGYPVAAFPIDAAQASATIRLEAGGTLDVVVRGAAGAPVANAAVRLLDADGAAMNEAMTMSNFMGTGGTTDEQGRARRDGLKPGKVTVIVKTPGGKETRAEAKIVAGETTTVEIATE